MIKLSKKMIKNYLRMPANLVRIVGKS